MCLPGMTEDYRLQVYFRTDQNSNLKIAFVCEDETPTLRNELDETTSSIF